MLRADLEKQLKLLPEGSKSREEGKNLLWELRGNPSGKTDEKFVIPQEPGTQMSIFDFM